MPNRFKKSQNAKQAETGRMLLVLTLPDE